jgi:aryl sulfotransferase
MTRIVWLASYPKSGNTWFRMLLANLSVKNGKPVDINDLPPWGGIASARRSFDDLLLIESGLLTHDEADCLRPRLYEEMVRDAEQDEADTTQQPPQVRFVKAHDAYLATPKGEPLLAGERCANGAIVIVRDPRDVVPSMANHHHSSIDDAIAFMNNTESVYCGKTQRQQDQLRQKLLDWSGNITSWLDQTDIPVHLIRYEDMLADTCGTLRRAIDFAGYPASDDDIQRAVDYAAFTELRRQEKEKGFAEASNWKDDRLFFRRGEAGAWRNELTAEQVARIEGAHAPMMRRLDYELASAMPLARAG